MYENVDTDFMLAMNILRYFGSLSHKLKGMYVNRKEVVDSINEMLKLRCQRGERKNDRTVLMKSGCSVRSTKICFYKPQFS